MEAAEFGTWESYFYPETYSRSTGQGVMRNLFGVRHADVLRDMEYAATMTRQLELGSGRVRIERNYDAGHLRAIHGYLFQDVYQWAGQFRTVGISKGVTAFADPGSGELERYLADVHLLAAGTDWQGLDRAGFIDRAARVFAYLNQAHPFREGNGRTAKVFMAHVAEQSRYRLVFAWVSPEAWNQASAFSGPDKGGYEPHHDELMPVFDVVTAERGMPASPGN